MAAVKAREEAEDHRIAEELAAVKRKAVLAAAETATEEAETEQAVGMLVKQKG